MDEILKLSKGEAWVWIYLSDLANKQETSNIFLPRMKENPWIPGVYSIRQFMRHLVSLEDKKFLTIVHRPVNQESQVVVALRPGLRLDMHVRADGHGSQGGGGNGGPERPNWTPMSRRRNPGNGDPTKAEEARADIPVGAAPQLSLAQKVIKEMALEAWIAMDQKHLLRAVMNLGTEELESLELRVMRVAPWAKAKARSRRAKLFAGIRFFQSSHQVKNPQAWVEGVAKRADYDMEQLRCKEASSEGDGRSQFPGESGRGSTFSSGRR
ncbi:MAG: hypothetical protein HY743_08835 [Deltaproteobacteria bacterium]|nr:hypothetical protein [Deltaproteobacteria bacterium]